MKNNPQDPYQKARDAALSLLSRRRHSSSEIRQKLTARGFDAGVIEKVLTECERLDYIDDENAAYYFMEELIRKQMGVRRIREAMNKRGFTSDQIQRMFDAHQLPDREPEIAGRALEKKKAALIRERDPRKRREKMIRFLRSRGFLPATISALLDRAGSLSMERTN